VHYTLGNRLGPLTTYKTFEVIKMDATTVSTITGAVDYATIITGIGTVAAAVVVVLVSVKGAKFLLSMVRGG
tara:strand:- start:116 stop:331 length:216 start_codon:yes stop_codon:yes gene_type:complete